MHNIGLLGALIIGPPILMMGVPFLGAIVFYGFIISLGFNLYFLIKKFKNRQSIGKNQE